MQCMIRRFGPITLRKSNREDCPSLVGIAPSLWASCSSFSALLPTCASVPRMWKYLPSQASTTGASASYAMLAWSARLVEILLLDLCGAPSNASPFITTQKSSPRVASGTHSSQNSRHMPHNLRCSLLALYVPPSSSLTPDVGHKPIRQPQCVSEITTTLLVGIIAQAGLRFLDGKQTRRYPVRTALLLLRIETNCWRVRIRAAILTDASLRVAANQYELACLAHVDRCNHRRRLAAEVSCISPGRFRR